MEAKNESVLCVVKIAFSAEDASELVNASVVKKAIIQRRAHGATAWMDVCGVDIGSVADLNFTITDYSARSHLIYEYRAVLSDGGTNYYSPIETVETKFNALLVANADKQYVCLANPKYSSSREHNIAYVKPYNSRYPHSVKNGISNYSKGTIEGYFNPLDNRCNLARVYADFTDELIDYLTDGKPKIIKTPEGNAWYVQIDPQVKLQNDGVIGIAQIGFSWTEIGEMPVWARLD